MPENRNFRLIRGGYPEVSVGSIRVVAAPKSSSPFDVDAIVHEEDTFLVLSADIAVRSFDGGDDFIKRDVIGSHEIRIQIYLILLDEAAHGSDFAYARNGQEGKTNVPVLNRPELVKIPPACGIPIFVHTFERIPEDLAQWRCVGTQRRFNSLG